MNAKILNLSEHETGRRESLQERIRAMKGRIVGGGLVERLASDLMPGGEVRHGRYWVRNPTRADSEEGSFNVRLADGIAKDFAVDAKAFDVVELVRRVKGFKDQGAALEWMEGWLGGVPSVERETLARKKSVERVGAKTLADLFGKRGAPDHSAAYVDRFGRTLFVMHRWEKRPHWSRKAFMAAFQGEDRLWYAQLPEGMRRPVYREFDAVMQPDAPLLVVEGELKAECAQEMLPGFVAVSSSGGAASAHKTDWAVVAGRRLLIWPDNHAEGMKYAHDVRALALAMGAAVVEVLPLDRLDGVEGVGEKFDAKDARLLLGWTETDVRRLWGDVIGRVESGEPMAVEPPVAASDAIVGQGAGSDGDEWATGPYVGAVLPLDGEDVPQLPTLTAADLERLGASSPGKEEAGDQGGGHQGGGVEWDFIDFSDLHQVEIPSPVFVLGSPVPHGGLIPRGECTLLSGDGAAGKSFLALSWAVHIALGLGSWGGAKCDRGRVLIVSAEDRRNKVRYRVQSILRAYGVLDRAPELAEWMPCVDATRGQPLAVERMIDGVTGIAFTPEFVRLQQLTEFFKPELIIIDNSSDVYGANENNRVQVRAFMRALAGLVEGHDGACVLLCHVSKDAAKKGGGGRHAFSGTTAWANSARSLLHLEKGKLTQEKTNHGALMEEPIPIVWADGCWKVDAGGIQSMRDERKQAETDAPIVLRAIHEKIRSGGIVTAADSNAANPWASIQSLLPAELQAKGIGKLRTLAAVHHLWLTGAIKRETYKNNSRQDKERWTPVDVSTERGEGEDAETS